MGLPTASFGFYDSRNTHDCLVERVVPSHLATPLSHHHPLELEDQRYRLQAVVVVVDTGNAGFPATRHAFADFASAQNASSVHCWVVARSWFAYYGPRNRLVHEDRAVSPSRTAMVSVSPNTLTGCYDPRSNGDQFDRNESPNRPEVVHRLSTFAFAIADRRHSILAPDFLHSFVHQPLVVIV